MTSPPPGAALRSPRARMPSFEILSRRKKEIMAEVERLGDEEDFHHFYWRLRDYDAACAECQRREGRLVNKYDIKYTLDTEYCVAEGDVICPFDLAPVKPKTVYEERERILSELSRMEEAGTPGVRWRTADVEGLDDRCIKRHDRVFTFEQARRQLAGEFCKFADPELGCQCVFEAASAEEVDLVRTPAAAAVPERKRSGCGAAAVLLAALPLAALLVALS